MTVSAAVFAALLLNVLTTLTDAKSGFLFTLPAVLQQGTTEKGCVTSQGLSYISVAVTLQRGDTTVLREYERLQDNGCFDLEIKADEVAPGEYTLVVTGSHDASGYSHTDNATVKVVQSKPIVFIQTDKPIYKPGQAVKIRTLVVGADLKPRLEPISEIFIENPNGVRMMQWLDEQVEKHQGIADLQMPLSTEPVQGMWKISIRPEVGGPLEEASFKVEEYVLPKYEISIKPPSYVIINAKEVEGEVCAMYTYGEPVKGVLSIKLCYERTYYSWQSDREPRACVEEERLISGCEPFKFDVTSLNIDTNRWGYSNGQVVFEAHVLENATGVTLNSTVRLDVTRELYRLDFKPYSSETFKPGLPYYGKVKVSHTDGTPAPNETVEIVVSNFRANKEFSKNFVSDSQGDVIFTLPPLRDDDATITVKASMPAYNFNYNEDRVMPYTPNGYHSLKQWYSPTKSFLQIKPVETVAACGESITLDIIHKAEESSDVTFFYQMMSHGNLLKTGKQRHSYMDSVKLNFSDDGTFDEGSLYECPEGKVWTNCGRGCTATCQDPNPVCQRSCVPQCTCEQPNSVIHEGRCITLDECSEAQGPPECSGGRVRDECGSACTPTCDDQQPMCTLQCVDRCVCPVSAPIWDGAKCITKHMCPGYVPPPGVKGSVVSLPLKILVTPEMSPEVKLIVYYVREDGETVADSLSLKVEECTQNKVELKFAETSRYPGEEASLSLRAAPGSVCSVGAVDKSVNLLGGKNTLTVSQVLSKLAQFDLSEQHIPGEDKYCEDQVKAREDEDERPIGRPDNGRPRPPGGANGGSPKPPGSRNGGRPRKGGRPVERIERSAIWPDTYYSQYYDSMHAFRELGGVVVGDLVVETRPCVARVGRVVYSAFMIPQERQAVLRPGGVVDSPLRESEIAVADAKPHKKTLDVRTYFPETWLWDLHLVGDSGEMTLTEKLPHTVTEWTASSFCMHKEQGLGVSSVTAIKGFQPFFLSLTLPVSVVRGEVLKLPVTVFNYLTECLVVKMTIQNSLNYTVLGQSESEQCVCGQETGTAYFSIRFTELGDVPIKVRAESVDNNGVCGNTLFMSDQIGERDAVERPLLVEAEGREEEFTESAYVCPPQGSSVTQNVTLALPEQYVAGTPRATVSVIGDIMGPTLSGLDNLVRLPMGCGEQNMILFAPNIYVMQYLKSTNQMTQEIKEKATGYMQTGYQRELTYRHGDGSYSAFGTSDASGSTWLTAYVLKSFAQAKQFIFIDEKDLKISADWLMTKQTERGCFQKVGTVHHKDMKGGVNGGASLTAFVLLALLEAKPHLNIENVDEAIDQAFHCLEFQSVTDTYMLSLLAYCYSLSGRDTAHSQQVLHQMKTRAIEKDDLTHWSRKTLDADPESVDGWAVRTVHAAPTATLDIEMTAYMLMAGIAGGGDDKVVEGIPLVKWLSTQRNSNGGFSSTQNTVVALQGLAKYAALAYQDGSDLSVVASSSDDYEVFRVSDTNRLVLQRKPFTVPATVKFEVSGSGCAFIQTTLKYNVANISRVQPSFSLSVAANRHAKCKVRTMDICAKYEGQDSASNMAVIEVKMVSGWIPEKSSIKDLLKDARLNLKKYEIDMNMVNFYFDELTAVQKCFSFLIEQHVEVDGAKPGKAEVYDYYDNTADMRVTEAYEIKPICGTKEELPIISQEEYDENNARDPSLIEQVRQPSGRRPPETKEDLPEVSPEEYERNNRRDPDNIEQMRQPHPGRRNPTKEDLPDVSQGEYDANNRGDPSEIEQMRQPNPGRRNPTKEDLPDVSQGEYDANNRRDPSEIEQVRRPNPGSRPGTKEDLDHLTPEEYDRANDRDVDDIEQVRKPMPEDNEEDIRDLIDAFDRDSEGLPEVVEPLIVPVEVIPLGNEELCPVCVDSLPENIQEEMCEKSHAYKAVLMSHKKYPIKLLTDFYDYQTNLNLRTHLVLPENCNCSHLTYKRNGKILILTPAEAERDASDSTKAGLILNSDSKIYGIPSSGDELRQIERKLRRVVKKDLCSEIQN